MPKKSSKHLTEESIGQVLTALSDSFDNELFSKEQSELESYWHFKWDESKVVSHNTYHFFDMLELYSSFCRRWETNRYGSCCVVERVRDKYIMPKIQVFISELEDRIKLKYEKS